MPSDRTIARVVLYTVVIAAAAMPLVILARFVSDETEVPEAHGAVESGDPAVHASESRTERLARAESTRRAEDADARGGAALRADAGDADSSSSRLLRQRDLAVGRADADRRRAPSRTTGDDSPDDFDPDRDVSDRVQSLLRSPDTAERLDGVDELAIDDPDAARREAENVLDSATEDRWDVYDKLIDLAADDGARIDVALRALNDADPTVRDQAAYWLSTEDADSHPQILDGLRNALAAESNSDARDSIESALESLDLDFVPEWLSQLDAEMVDPEQL